MYYATAKQMSRLDELAVKNGLEIRQMMELAGWQMLVLFRQLKISKKNKITIIIGKGNKGGDGLSAARHLANYGYKVWVILLSKKITLDASHHLQLVNKMKLPIYYYLSNKNKIRQIINGSDILVDSLIGYNLQGPPRGIFKEVIEIMNQSKKKIIAYDLPTGFDPTTGECLTPCIKAFATLTLALPKTGFKKTKTKKMCGRIFVGDIGIPDFLYNKIARNSRPRFEKPPKQLIELG
jgi:NAD(P)H-hydrate epimerase